MTPPDREEEVGSWLGRDPSSPVNVSPERASHLSKITQQFEARPGLRPRSSH